MSDKPEILDNNNDNNNGHYSKGLTEVVQFRDFLNPDRRNISFPELGFDIDTFENLCADFNPEDEILNGLSVNRETMNQVCKKVYGMPFHETYLKLSGIAKMLTRKAYNNLAKSGNASAMAIQQSYLNLGNNSSNSQPIQIVLDINKKDQ